jgi:hypothetical protein
VEWSEDYWVGAEGGDDYKIGAGYVIGSPVAKELQEHWLGENGGGRPFVAARPTDPPPAAPLSRIPSANLVPFGRAYVGTLSALPVGGTAQHLPPRSNGRLPETPEAARAAKGKVLLVLEPTRGATPTEKHAVTSYNEIVRAGANVVVSHHTYDGPLVDVLQRLTDHPGHDEVDILLRRYSPPPRALLPGDVSWQTQKQTEHCASFSMASAMNYWFPLTNNGWRASGETWVKRIHQMIGDSGATPAAVVEAAPAWSMNARFRSGKHLDDDRAERLLKLWLWAGVPVIVNIVEGGKQGFWGAGKHDGRHFKLAVGYDGDRYFFQNSGIDWERAKNAWTVALSTAPLGNDVDMRAAFLAKWNAVTEGVAGTFVGMFTTDRNFIPVYPKDRRFRGTSAR